MINKSINFFKNGFEAIKIRNFNDLKNMYYGNVPLVYIFWIFGFFVLLPMELLHRGLSYGIQIFENLYITNLLLIIDYAILLIYIPLEILNIIAIWRSANKYTGRKIWRKITKTMIVISCIFYIIGMAVFFMQGFLDETQRILNAQQNTALLSNTTIDSELVAS